MHRYRSIYIVCNDYNVDSRVSMCPDCVSSSSIQLSFIYISFIYTYISPVYR